MCKYLIGSTLQKKQKEFKSFVTHLQLRLVADYLRVYKNKTGNILQSVQEQIHCSCQRTIKRKKIQAKTKLNTSTQAGKSIKCLCLLDWANTFLTSDLHVTSTTGFTIIFDKEQNHKELQIPNLNRRK